MSTEQTNRVKEIVKKFSRQSELPSDARQSELSSEAANDVPQTEALNDVPIKLETRGRKKKYQNDEDRLNARKEQQKKYRERQKEKVKELLSLIEGLSEDDIIELKNKAQELRASKNIVDE